MYLALNPLLNSPFRCALGCALKGMRIGALETEALELALDLALDLVLETEALDLALENEVLVFESDLAVRVDDKDADMLLS
jgi:hypothetical protein